MSRLSDAARATPRLGIVLGTAVAAVTVAAQPALADDCPNAAVRAQQSAQSLGDCRAYEMVSPANKLGGDVMGFLTNARGSANGDRAVFASFTGFDDPRGVRYVVQYRGQRGPGGWTSEPLTPAQNFGRFSPIFNTSGPAAAVGLSPDLTTVFDVAGDPAPAAGAQPRTYNLYERDDSGNYTLITPAGTINPLLNGFADSTDDFSNVIFESTARLTADAPVDRPDESASLPRGNLYQRIGGRLRLVGYLPDGTPAPEGAFAGYGDSGLGNGGGALGGYYTERTMSRDGRIIFWTDVAANALYARVDGTRTVPVSASQRSPVDPDGQRSAFYMGAADDGSIVYFTSEEKLTDDSTAGPNAANLYSFDMGSRRLTALTAVPDATANVNGTLGVSEDGRTVYFVATGDPLAAGAVQDGANLYVQRNGAIKFIATLSSDVLSDSWNWAPRPPVGYQHSSRVSADGSVLLFSSVARLIDDNLGFNQIYRYEPDRNSLICVSCGSPRPVSDAALGRGAPFGQGVVQGAAPFLTRVLSRDGSRVFFQTADSLAPQDTNGRVDVYQWQGGSVSLISSGLSDSDSHMGDANEDGSSVFFTTRQRLVATDIDANADMYVAKTDGGYLLPVAPPACTGSECQGNPSVPPALQPPATDVYFGPGNVVPPAERAAGRVRVAPVKQAALARFKRTGRLTLRVNVTEPGAVTVTAKTTVRRRLRVIGRATKVMSRPGSASVTLRLSANGRRAINRRGRPVVRVTVSQPGAASKTARLVLPAGRR